MISHIISVSLFTLFIFINILSFFDILKSHVKYFEYNSMNSNNILGIVYLFFYVMDFSILQVTIQCERKQKADHLQIVVDGTIQASRQSPMMYQLWLNYAGNDLIVFFFSQIITVDEGVVFPLKSTLPSFGYYLCMDGQLCEAKCVHVNSIL